MYVNCVYVNYVYVNCVYVICITKLLEYKFYLFTYLTPHNRDLHHKGVISDGTGNGYTNPFRKYQKCMIKSIPKGVRFTER